MKNLISIILPIYNGEQYLEKLVTKIKEQEIENELELIALVSPSYDNSLKKARELFDKVIEVKKFNHAKTRHEGALVSKGEILVFITQDILPYDKFWLKNLISPLNGEIIASFSRQIAYAHHSETEKIIREFSYPEYNRICNIQNAKKNGRKNIFYSDASSAILKQKFFELGGYNFEVPTSEDVYLANKIIKKGYSFIYVADSKIWHSHQLTLRELYKRYKNIGNFEKNYLKNVNFIVTQKEGEKLVFYLLKKLIRNKNLKELILLPINIGIRWIGYKRG